jgi:hypothetical protein
MGYKPIDATTFYTLSKTRPIMKHSVEEYYDIYVICDLEFLREHASWTKNLKLSINITSIVEYVFVIQQEKDTVVIFEQRN